MRAFHIAKDGTKTEITQIITTLSISGEYRSCVRSCSFGIIHGYSDERTWLITIETGDILKVINGDKILFQGPIWTKQKQTDGTTIDFTAKDYGIYLKKNKGSYNFASMTAEAITRKVCGDFGLQIGSLALTGKPISRIFRSNTLYDIIMTAYSIGGNGKKYYAKFEGELFYVLEKGKVEVEPLESGVNLLTADVCESLEGMVNRVRVYNKEDTLGVLSIRKHRIAEIADFLRMGGEAPQAYRHWYGKGLRQNSRKNQHFRSNDFLLEVPLLREFTNAEDTALYGFLSEIIRVSTEKEDYTEKAEKTLVGLERKITVTNFGDAQYMTGRRVVVQEPYTGLSGIFFIDGDTHTWKNGIYTNRLTLNFQNMMDEKEGGSEA